MKHISTVLNQFLQIIPHNEFDKLVKELKTDHYTKHFKSWNLMTVLMIAQAKGQDSLRHIVTSLRHRKNTWSHLGIKGISKSTLADGNSRVNPALFEQLFYVLLKKTQGQTKQGYTGKKKGRFRFKNPVYSMDSSTIDHCLYLIGRLSDGEKEPSNYICYWTPDLNYQVSPSSKKAVIMTRN